MKVLNKITVAFETATYAIKAKRIMQKLGKNVKLVKLTGSKRGCTHGAEIDGSDLYMLIKELKARNIAYTVL